MQTQRINITLPQKVLKLLRSSIPEGQRSRFISRIIEEKLEGEEKTKMSFEESLKANYAFDKKIMNDWKTVDAEKWPD